MTFGINGAELIILILLAVLVLGPEKLPEYARKLTEWIRNLRSMAEGAKSQFREETGTDFDEIDWKKYDPRQYDPRRIIREALSEPVDGGTRGAAAASVTGTSESPGSANAPAAPRDGLRGDLDAVRGQRDALRDDLKDMDPRSLLFGPSSRRGGARSGVAAASTGTAEDVGTAATVDATDAGDPGADISEAGTAVAGTTDATAAEASTDTEPAPFDPDAT